MSDFLELDDILNLKRPLTVEEYRMAILYAKASEYSSQNLYRLLMEYAPTENGRKIAGAIYADEKSHEFIWAEEEAIMATDLDKVSAEKGRKQYGEIIKAPLSQIFDPDEDE